MAQKFWSMELSSLLKKSKLFSPSKQFNPRDRALKLEEKTLALSGLQPHKDIQIFDVPIKYKGQHYLHTITCGEKNKETLVLIHGYCGSLVLFYPILKDLCTRFKVYCVDLLGLGLSSRPDFTCTSTEETLNYFVDSLEEWRKALNLKKFYMGGHSFGGYISVQYALKYSNRVNGLYLFSPTGVTEKHEEEPPREWAAKMSWTKRQFWLMYFQVYSRILWKEKLTPPQFIRNHSSLGKFFIRSYIQVLYGTNLEHAELVSDFLFEMFLIPGGSEKAIHYVLKPPRCGAHIPLEAIIQKYLKLPIYCYYGEEDWVDWTGAYKITQTQKSKYFKFQWISSCGHQMIIQKPKELSELVLSTPRLRA
jgi:abhydrolase domain-containing protein 5